MKPNKKNIQLWVDALRSGKYRQGAGKLKKFNPKSKHYHYCCLGVACDVAIKNGLNLDTYTNKTVNNDRYVSFEGGASFLGFSMMKWLGLYFIDPVVPYEGQHIGLSTLNDNYLLKFKQLADLIEKEYLK